jgi:hypothetical protein
MDFGGQKKFGTHSKNVNNLSTWLVLTTGAQNLKQLSKSLDG